MAKNVLKEIMDLTEESLSRLSKSELENLVARGSKSINQNLRRLAKSKYGPASQYLQKNDGKSGIKERKIEQARKLTKTELKKEIRKIKRTAESKTSSTKGTKETIERVKEKTGVDITGFTKDDWEKIRRSMESNQVFSSSDIIASYDEIKEKDFSYEYLKVKTQEKILDREAQKAGYRNISEYLESAEGLRESYEREISIDDLF